MAAALATFLKLFVLTMCSQRDTDGVRTAQASAFLSASQWSLSLCLRFRLPSAELWLAEGVACVACVCCWRGYIIRHVALSKLIADGGGQRLAESPKDEQTRRGVAADDDGAL